MMWTIAKHEFLSNVISLRFFIGSVLCLVLMVSSMYVLTDDYAMRLEAYDNSVREHLKEAKQTMVFSNLRIMIDRPPAKLSFLCIGADSRMGNITQAGYQQVPSSSWGGEGENPFMVVFPSLDAVVIIQMALSLLALLFSYDTISGERERGTLAQILSNPVPRYQLLMGKYIGGMLSIALPLLMAFLAALTITSFSGHVALTGADWVRIGLFALTSLLYVSIFFALGALLSTLTVRPTTSLIFALFLWVFLVTIAPNLGPYVAKQVRPVEDKSVLSNQASSLRSEMTDKMNSYVEKLRRDGLFPEKLWLYQKGHALGPHSYGVGYAPKENLRWYLARTRYLAPLQLQYANRIWELHQEYNRDLESQRSLARSLSRISPAWTYYNASATLLGTDIGSYLRFMDQARKYRQELISYAESNGGLASLRYFTRMTMDDAPTIAEAEKMVAELGRDGFDRKMMEYMAALKPLSHIPIFQYEPERVPGSVRHAMPDLAILAIVNVIVLMAAHASFIRRRVK